jgi:hypothetical protein
VESRTRRGLSRFLAGALALGSLAAIARASAGTPSMRGTFALLEGTPKVVSELRTFPGRGTTANLKIRQFKPDGSTPIVDYEIDMQVLMHVIVVRDDFLTFEHLHPAFDAATGTFSQAFAKERYHRYYVFADSEPKGMGQQVFRFTLPSDGPIATGMVPSMASTPSVPAGPYVVTLSATTLPANAAQTLDLTITKNGRPAQDLGTYLGAAAHVVFISVPTLTYVHVHPHVAGSSSAGPAAAMPQRAGMHMDMADERAAGPNMKMELPALPAALYKVWVQFRGANDKLYTAPFTVRVQ